MAQSIPPGLAVREALGLSIADAQEILGPTADIAALDQGYSPLLANIMALLDGEEGASLSLEIRNPDGSLFKSWTVTTEGMLEDVCDPSTKD